MSHYKAKDDYDDDEDDYDYSDESFDSDPPPKGSAKKKIAAVSKKTGMGTKGKGKGANKPSRAGSQATPRTDPVIQRVLSARKLKINELKNEITDMVVKMRDLREENKLLKKTQYRQEKALSRFQDEESDLPQIMARHSNEIRTIKEQLRKTKDKYERTDRYLRDAEDDLEKMKSKLKKYKKLADEHDLEERSELASKMHKAELDLEEKESRIKELEKHITNLNKNHRHEIGIEVARQREHKKMLQQLREQNDQLESQLKEKMKELDKKNIYTSRRNINSYHGTPHDTPPPSNRRRRPPSVHDLNPREKMKLYEERRRQEAQSKREITNTTVPKLPLRTSSPTYGKGDHSQTKPPTGRLAKSKFASKSSPGKGAPRRHGFLDREDKKSKFSYENDYDDDDGDHRNTYRKDNDSDSYMTHQDKSKHKSLASKPFGKGASSSKPWGEDKTYGSRASKDKSKGFQNDSDDDEPSWKKTKPSPGRHSPELGGYQPSKGPGREDYNYSNTSKPSWLISDSEKPAGKASSLTRSNETTASKKKWPWEKTGNDTSEGANTVSRQRGKRLNGPRSVFDITPPSSSSSEHKPFRFKQEKRAQEERERKEHERRQEEEREQQDRWEREEKDRQDRQRRQKEEDEAKEREKEQRRREREERDRREAEEYEQKRERDRLKKEAEERRREAEEREKRDAEEKQRRAEEEREREQRDRERRAREERERHQMDQQMQEERRKKDELLAKLRAIDEGKKGGNKVESPPEKDSFFITKRQDSDIMSTSSSKKSYSFAKPIENMHQGKPSHEDVTVPYIERQKKKNKERKDSLDGDIGGYQPSFTTGRKGAEADKKKNSIMVNEDFSRPPRGRAQNKNKKSDLMSDLFGSSVSESKSKKDSDDLFSSNAFGSTNGTNKSGFPWEDDSKAKTTTKKDNSTSLFGGGNSLFDDDKPQDSSKMLPRRPRQQTTFQSRPAVTAVDHYDDDIEEVIL